MWLTMLPKDFVEGLELQRCSFVSSTIAQNPVSFRNICLFQAPCFFRFSRHWSYIWAVFPLFLPFCPPFLWPAMLNAYCLAPWMNPATIHEALLLTFLFPLPIALDFLLGAPIFGPETLRNSESLFGKAPGMPYLYIFMYLMSSIWKVSLLDWLKTNTV